MKRVLIIGRGQVGTLMHGALEGFETVLWNGDIDEITSEDLLNLDLHAVVNSAGKTDLSWCELNARETMRSNLEAPVRLYLRILKHNRTHGANIRFIQFSSGCVWDGPFDEQGKPFTPKSPISPACLYTWTKAASDALMLQQDPTNVALLRPRQVFSSVIVPRNTLSKLLRYPALVDTPNSMSSAAIIIRTVLRLLEAEKDWTGIWSVYDKGWTTPFRVGQMLAEAGLRDMPQRMTKADLDSWHHPKRVDTVLYDARFEEWMNPRPVEEELQREIAEFKRKGIAVGQV